jgi:hypothetical protein
MFTLNNKKRKKKCKISSCGLPTINSLWYQNQLIGPYVMPKNTNHSLQPNSRATTLFFHPFFFKKKKIYKFNSKFETWLYVNV